MPAHAFVEREPEHAARDTAALLSEVLGPPEGWGVSVRLWDGSLVGPADTPATVVLRHPWSLRRMLWPSGDVSAGEAFVFGDVDVEGDFEAVFRAFAPAIDLESRQPRRMAQLMWQLWRLPAPPARQTRPHASAPTGVLHSRARDREAVRHHYDVPTEFFRLWLDSHMQYSCAYFEHEGDDLEAAQAAKLAHICRKLRMKPGDRLLDIGCGWGGLLEYAASHYGIRGLGVTLSEPQATEANARLARAGVASDVRAEVLDYRDIEGEFDAIVSVGMVEHVGAVNLGPYFSKAFALLKPGGVFLNHGIASAWEEPGQRRVNAFVQRYVFPDSELVPISRMLAESERAGFEVRDVENLREHYAATLRHWVRRLQDGHQAAVRAADEAIYRIWVLYMTGCAFSFERGAMELFQSLLHKPTGGHSRLPPTRADWYAHMAGTASQTPSHRQ